MNFKNKKKPTNILRAGALACLASVLSAGVASAADVTINLTGNDAMQYNKTSFTVKAGQKVEIIFKHIGKLPKVAMGHNVVILNKKADPAKFAVEAMKFAVKDYIPSTMKSSIIAHTKMVGGGETTSIVFTAPAKSGKYPYLCTFPGHAALMKGVMKVE